MALDAQLNWNVSMAENFAALMERGNTSTDGATCGSTPDLESLDMKYSPRLRDTPWDTDPVHLPDEIIIQIVDFIARTSNAQQSLAACCLLSRQWYSATVPTLYSRPVVRPRNFDLFSRTICPSKNLHIQKSPLADFVRVLNMGTLVHHGSNSFTARLLSRTKKELEEFVAPTATFGLTSLPPLSKCHKLRSLDLSLVSQSPFLPELLKALTGLERLAILRLPRSSGFDGGLEAVTLLWPPNLENLTLSGRMGRDFFSHRASFPDSLESLTIEYCPLAKGSSVIQFIQTSVRCLPCLKTLRLRNLRAVKPMGFNNVLSWLPGLENFSVSIDYITDQAFDIFDDYDLDAGVFVQLSIDPEEFGRNASPLHAYPLDRGCRLRFLELTHSGGSNIEDKLSPWAIEEAVSRGALPYLRQVRVARSLRWRDLELEEATEDLAREMQAAALRKRSGDVADHREADVGVWEFDGQRSYLP